LIIVSATAIVGAYGIRPFAVEPGWANVIHGRMSFMGECHSPLRAKSSLAETMIKTYIYYQKKYYLASSCRELKAIKI
jgi:hypothetical protein